jgi:hypothetical protein
MATDPQQATTSAAPAERLGVLGRPVFVGGVPGSGLRAVAVDLLGRHHRLAATVPAELRFLTEPGGLCDEVAGTGDPAARLRVSVAARARGLRSPADGFHRRMVGHWYADPPLSRASTPGLSESVTVGDLLAAVDRHRQRSQADPVSAARHLVAELVDPSVRAAGKQRWVDCTPGNAQRIGDLYRIFPDLSLIHVVADGRAVAIARIGRNRPAADYAAVLREWGDAVIAGYSAVLGIPLGRAHTVYPEQLFGPDGLPAYERLLDFLGVYDSPRTRAFWVRQVKRRRYSPRRWREGLAPGEQAAVDRVYGEQLARIEAAGAPVPPGR